jgi:hypothetical protein
MGRSSLRQKLEVIVPEPHFPAMDHAQSLSYLLEFMGELEPDDDDTWHEVMQSLPKLLNVSQSAIAELFEVPPSTFSRWQHSTAPHPRLRELYIAMVCKILREKLAAIKRKGARSK